MVVQSLQQINKIVRDEDGNKINVCLTCKETSCMHYTGIDYCLYADADY